MRRLNTVRLFLLGWGVVVVAGGAIYLATAEPTAGKKKRRSLASWFRPDRIDSAKTRVDTVDVGDIRAAGYAGDERRVAVRDDGPGGEEKSPDDATKALPIERIPGSGRGVAQDDEREEPSDSAKQAARVGRGMIVDVRAIAGRDSATVVRHLGAATSAGVEGPLSAYSFRGGRVRVSFREGVAERIRIGQVEQIPFRPTLLVAIGLPAAPPTQASADVLRWDGLAGLGQVRAVSSPDGGVDHILVTAARRP